MSTPSKVAIVTGANKGIGFETVKLLSHLLPKDAVIILTARNAEDGNRAASEALFKAGCEHVVFHQLDITDHASVMRLRDHVEKTYGGCDILINNAGFAYKMSATEPFGVQAKETNKINFYGTLDMCRQFLPLLKENGRLVNVSSSAGSIHILGGHKQSHDLHHAFERADLTEEELCKIIDTFISLAEQGTHHEHGWPNSAYSVSKLAVNMLTRIMARDVAKYNKREGIVVCCCCPGWCKTDMAGWEKPPKTATEGADTPAFLAALPAGPEAAKFHGHFVQDKEVKPF